MQMFHSMSMNVMIPVLMSPRDPSAEKVDEHVKIYLSCCHRFYRSYYSKEKTFLGQYRQFSNTPLFGRLTLQTRANKMVLRRNR